jgi:hypothetical protein
MWQNGKTKAAMKTMDSIKARGIILVSHEAGIGFNEDLPESGKVRIETTFPLPGDHRLRCSFH